MAEDYLSSSAEAVVKLFSEFTLRKIVEMILFILLIFCALILFDRLTATFSLQRIDRSITLLDRLNKLNVASDPQMQAIKVKLTRDLDLAVDPKPLSEELYAPFSGGIAHRIKLAVTDSNVWSRLLTSMAPWVFVVLFAVKNLINRVPHTGKGMIMMLTIGFVFALLGLMLPSIGWLDYFIYPGGQFLLICVLSLFFANAQKRKLQSANSASSTLPRPANQP